MKRFSIIGAGNVGKTIAAYLDNSGMLEWILARSDKSFDNIKNVVKNTYIIRNISDINEFPEFTILAVSDNSINEIALNISAEFNDLSNKHFFHCSGTLSGKELYPLTKAGAITAAIHPYQTFYNSGKSILNDIPWGIDCLKKNIKTVYEAIYLLNGIPVELSKKAKKHKELYHISAIAASNYLNTIISLSYELLSEIEQDPIEFIKPIIQTTLNNNYEMLSINSDKPPMTGPIIRGDIDIITRHLKALDTLPMLKTQYKLLGLATLEAAFHKELIGENIYNEMKNLLK